MYKSDNTIMFSRQIESMFSSIASRYDFLNRILSIGRDRYWRKVAIDKLAPSANERILDIATGTGDMLLEIASRNQSIQIMGVDFSKTMLDISLTKIKKNGFDSTVSLQMGNSECLPFADTTFDGVVCAFGIRNFFNAKLALVEFFRVLKPGGRAIILEFSMPTKPILKYFYELYFDVILPKVGKLISRHDFAYSYLPASVKEFPDKTKFVYWIEEVGFQNVNYHELTFGVVSIYCGYKAK